MKDGNLWYSLLKKTCHQLSTRTESLAWMSDAFLAYPDEFMYAGTRH